MRVVDTSAWIEWLTGSALGKRLERELPERTQWIVPTIVQLELAKWLLREKGEDEADRVMAFSMKCKVVPLDTRLALLAVESHRQHGLATADAIVHATAQNEGADLLTCDGHFSGLPGAIVYR
ncbi:MAG: type II toxin-antitoxin system VapC family toxin [Alphaproteobacteria bacterium]|nr:type II toxin-antitoxin system VapC family toxin [Alphaproteobacteria bacterium]